MSSTTRIYFDTMYLVAYAFNRTRDLDGFSDYFRKRHYLDLDMMDDMEIWRSEAIKRGIEFVIPTVTFGEVIKKCMEIIDDYAKSRKRKKPRGAGRRIKSEDTPPEDVRSILIGNLIYTYVKGSDPFRLIDIGGPMNDKGIHYGAFVEVLSSIHNEIKYLDANYADRVILAVAAADRYATRFVTADGAFYDNNDVFEAIKEIINRVRAKYGLPTDFKVASKPFSLD